MLRNILSLIVNEIESFEFIQTQNKKQEFVPEKILIKCVLKKKKGNHSNVSQQKYNTI
jgi:hypothetical protein